MERDGNACDLCGRVLGPAHLGRHRGSRPCRQRQIERAMAERGLHPLPNLDWSRLVRKAGIRHERFPGNARNAYRSERLWRCERPPLVDSFDDEFYADLGDRLFVEAWAHELLLNRSSMDMPPHRLAEMLRRVAARGEEFQLALCTTLAIGGPDAFNATLVAEGIWSWEKRRKR